MNNMNRDLYSNNESYTALGMTSMMTQMQQPQVASIIKYIENEDSMDDPVVGIKTMEAWAARLTFVLESESGRLTTVYLRRYCEGFIGGSLSTMLEHDVEHRECFAFSGTDDVIIVG